MISPIQSLPGIKVNPIVKKAEPIRPSIRALDLSQSPEKIRKAEIIAKHMCQIRPAAPVIKQAEETSHAVQEAQYWDNREAQCSVANTTTSVSTAFAALAMKAMAGIGGICAMVFSGIKAISGTSDIQAAKLIRKSHKQLQKHVKKLSKNEQKKYKPMLTYQQERAHQLQCRGTLKKGRSLIALSVGVLAVCGLTFPYGIALGTLGLCLQTGLVIHKRITKKYEKPPEKTLKEVVQATSDSLNPVDRQMAKVLGFEKEWQSEIHEKKRQEIARKVIEGNQPSQQKDKNSLLADIADLSITAALSVA